MSYIEDELYSGHASFQDHRSYSSNSSVNPLEFSANASPRFVDLPRDMQLEILRNSTDAELYHYCTTYDSQLSLCSYDNRLSQRVALITSRVNALVSDRDEALGATLNMLTNQDERKMFLREVAQYQTQLYRPGHLRPVLNINSAVQLVFHGNSTENFELKFMGDVTQLITHDVPSLLQLIPIRNIEITLTDGDIRLAIDYLDNVLSPNIATHRVKYIKLEYKMVDDQSFPWTMLRRFANTLERLYVEDLGHQHVQHSFKQLFGICRGIKDLLLDMKLDSAAINDIGMLTNLRQLHLALLHHDDYIENADPLQLPSLSNTLRHLTLENCRLSSNVNFPRQLHSLSLKNIIYFDDGVVPDEVGKIYSLKRLVLDNDPLSYATTLKKLSPSILQLPNLRQLLVNSHHLVVVNSFNGNLSKAKAFEQELLNRSNLHKHEDIYNDDDEDNKVHYYLIFIHTQ